MRSGGRTTSRTHSVYRASPPTHSMNRSHLVIYPRICLCQTRIPGPILTSTSVLRQEISWSLAFHGERPTADCFKHRNSCEVCVQGKNEPPDGNGRTDWVTCLACPVAGHWQCLQPHQQLAVSSSNGAFICGACHRDGICIGCLEKVTPITAVDVLATPRPLLFRCETCKRPAHYKCVPSRPGDPAFPDAAPNAYYYQTQWLCLTCSSVEYKLDKILAWRPYPQDAECTQEVQQPPSRKDFLAREYLVKFKDRSYHRLMWLPHMWFRQDPLRAPRPNPDAEREILSAWKIVGRVLDIRLWSTTSAVNAGLVGQHKALPQIPQRHGQYPHEELTQRLSEWELENGKFRIEDNEHVSQIAWAFVKWCALGYDDVSWDSPPPARDSNFSMYFLALKQFFVSREIKVPLPDDVASLQRKVRAKNAQIPDITSGFQLGQHSDLSLMGFQVDGVNWLRKRWWTSDPCILADDMGLGKTVQMAVFLGSILKEFPTRPSLIVVPLTTIHNWVTEIERWAPNIRVVAFFGNPAARQNIKDFELYHSSHPSGQTDLKFHVLVAPFEMVNHPQEKFLFQKIEWENIIIDEGQRLKGEAGVLRSALEELKSAHRILMTGTPVNNNVKELVNLMCFLDRKNWTDLDWQEIDRQHRIDSTEIDNVTTRLQPYLLRRTKDEVLALPLKGETIVHIAMVPSQRDLYDQILSNGERSNVLMALRLCAQHPYAHNEALLDSNPAAQIAESGGKLWALKLLLPSLKTRGRRVLLFTQFTKVLDVVEAFLEHEGYQYLRMDGKTDADERQRDMDWFNNSDSDVFIYILTTRSGGVGINLFTADTVIIFDPDYNPHQDSQAVCRAYRYGQQKTCLVFTLVTADSVEERIMEIREHKIVLDELVVQNIKRPIGIDGSTSKIHRWMLIVSSNN
ncbi:P-loop containing nucleoside triphosphate hydrolase protein [Mycena polygramma]|nr:P-loop containing nucleoside triphosphate hydrolase protein [Mycena polygramma]